MKINKITINNFRGIDQATFELSDKLNVFVGLNGSGKSTILDAAVVALSWLVNRIQREGASGRPITESSIKNGTTFSSIETEVEERGANYSWRISRALRGYDSPNKSELSEATDLASYYQHSYKADNSLPIIAYYPINRVVNNASPFILSGRTISTFDVYDNALGGKTNYQSFFEWFRLQDDIVNEQVNSRTKWMFNNKAWIKKKTSKLFTSFETLIKNNDENYQDVRRSIEHRFKNEEFIFEDPRYVFMELIDLMHFNRYSTNDDRRDRKLFQGFELILHKISTISDSRRDRLIDLDEYPFSTIFQILQQIIELKKNLENEPKDDQKWVSILWDAFLLSVLLSLWWLSDKGKKDIELLFAKDNPTRFKRNGVLDVNVEAFIDSLKSIISNDADRYNNATRNQGRELNFVARTIEDFVPGYANLRVKRIPRPHMLVDKNGETISLDQLSDGEKNLLALVGDIARRLCIANANSKNPLKGQGIILIDEIDLHLHPGWQRLMIPQLTKSFPNCQFIITTHSPQVISHTKPENIFLLKNEKTFSFAKAMESYGKNTDRILEDLLGVDARPGKEKQSLRDLFALIQDGRLDSAKQKLNDLLELIGEDPEITRAQTLIKRKEIIGK